MRTVGSKVTSRSWIWDFLWYQTCPDHSEKLTDLGRKVCRRCWMKLKSDWTLPPKDWISSRNTQCSVFTNSWEFSGSPVLRAVLSLQRAQIQSPVWDLRFHKLHAAITHTHTHTHTHKSTWAMSNDCTDVLCSLQLWILVGFGLCQVGGSNYEVDMLQFRG